MKNEERGYTLGRARKDDTFMLGQTTIPCRCSSGSGSVSVQCAVASTAVLWLGSHHHGRRLDDPDDGLFSIATT